MERTHSPVQHVAAAPAVRSDYVSRFKVLFNGFPTGRSFASLREAQDAVVGHRADDEVEIYDTVRKQYVWVRPGYLH